MASKKFTLVMALLIAGMTVGYSQLGGILNYHDSTKVSSKKLPQFNEWKNNQHPFPPVPRHMAQFSVFGGFNILDGDCPSLPGWQVGGSIRKALGYSFSVRGTLSYGVNKGLDYRRNAFFFNNNNWMPYGRDNGGPGYFVANYKTNLWMSSLDLIASINNIMFHRERSKVDAYLYIGYNPIAYKTVLNARNGDGGDPTRGSIYNYTSDPNTFFDRSRKEIRKDMRNILDDTYETPARVNDRRMNFGNADATAWQWRHAYNFGGGFEYRLAPRMSMTLDSKYVKVHDDYIDGWYLGQAGALTPEKDYYFVTNLGLNFNL